MSDLQTQFDHLISEHQRIRAEFQKSAQELFKNITKEFFATNPGITAFIWTQFVPSFNDGDPCEFTVGDVTFTNAIGADLDDVSPYGEYEGENEEVQAFSSWNLKSMSMEGVDAGKVKLMETMISSYAMEQVLEEMFGRYVKIVASPDGFAIDDYDCGH
jgi:hypothetical protein